ncbi:MAG TPA: hypothetical protein VEO53_04250, partial [Candidatus Binatia bacterium]|nr:hypothetical protein [Candidatus Binatia bacterium]
IWSGSDPARTPFPAPDPGPFFEIRRVSRKKWNIRTAQGTRERYEVIRASPLFRWRVYEFNLYVAWSDVTEPLKRFFDAPRPFRRSGVAEAEGRSAAAAIAGSCGQLSGTTPLPAPEPATRRTAFLTGRRSAGNLLGFSLENRWRNRSTQNSFTSW